MIIEESLARGWKTELYTAQSPHLRLGRIDGSSIEIFSSLPSTTSFAAARLCDDKFLTHLALLEVGLPVLPTYLCYREDEARIAARAVLDAADAYVVKPLDASHGNGVTVGLTSLDALAEPLQAAQVFSPSVIIQACQPDAIDIRVLCINNKFVAALERIPARVMGDGLQTIEELIITENAKTTRGDCYTTELTTIPIESARLFLGDTITAVPPKGEWIQVLGTANVGTGGETRDITDELPQWLIKMSEKAAKTLSLATCGVDFLLDKAPEVTHTPQTLKTSITEVNKAPSLFIHERPNHGTPRPVVAAYLDYLATV
jgi:cyanophycin synthetase